MIGLYFWAYNLWNNVAHRFMISDYEIPNLDVKCHVSIAQKWNSNWGFKILIKVVTW